MRLRLCVLSKARECSLERMVHNRFADMSHSRLTPTLVATGFAITLMHAEHTEPPVDITPDVPSIIFTFPNMILT